MPEAKWKVISLRDYVYDAVAQRAKENHRSISGELEQILEEAKIIPKEVPAR